MVRPARRVAEGPSGRVRPASAGPGPDGKGWRRMENVVPGKRASAYRMTTTRNGPLDTTLSIFTACRG